jgi:cardiolipin synthase
LSLRQIPNSLCVLRMLLVVPTVGLLIRAEYAATLLVFAVAAVTDALDGFLAKRFDWTSELGKVLDPIADKLLLVAAFVTLAVIGLSPGWLAATVVLRDVIIALGAGIFRYRYGELRGHPTSVSKFNTLCQILYVLAVVAAAALGWPDASVILGLGALVFVTTVVSGTDYVLTYARRAAVAERARAT